MRGRTNRQKCFAMVMLLGLIVNSAMSISPTALASNITVEENESSHMNIVMLVDETGSMRSSDPDRISVQGAMLFADLMEISDSALSVVGFAAKPRDMTNGLGNMRTLYDFDDHYDIVADIKSDIQKSREGTTDIAAALEAAIIRMEKVKYSNSKKKKAVVLFTDGKNEFSLTVDSTELAKRAAADNECERLSRLLRDEYDCDLYIIALNVDKSINRDLLEKMITANRANRKVNVDEFLYIVDGDSIKELPQFYQDAFARLTGSASIPFDEKVGLSQVDFSVTAMQAAVDEIDIVILPALESNKKSNIAIDSVLCTDKTGVTRDLRYADFVYISEQDKYTLVKIRRDRASDSINPKIPEGEWTIRLGGTDTDVLIAVFGMQNENIRTRVKLDGIATVGEKLAIVSEIYDGNNDLFSAERSRKIRESNIVITGAKPTEIPLTYVEQGVFSAEWTPETTGEYDISTRFVVEVESMVSGGTNGEATIESRRKHVSVVAATAEASQPAMGLNRTKSQGIFRRQRNGQKRF